MEKSAPLPAGSGDPRLDRRFAWAQAAVEAGDLAEAADILAQTLDEAPRFTAARHLLGVVLAAQGRLPEAEEAWRACLALDPDDRLGAGLDLARIGALPAEAVAAAGFAAALFDAYADRFDAHLLGALEYRAPALLMDAVARHCAGQDRPFAFAEALDLGCGTGLMGEALRSRATVLVGCDLSSRMVAKAAAKGLYDSLAVAGLVEFLAGRPAHSAELVAAADVFVYLGDLRPAFAAAARVLAPSGLLAFTVQSHAGDGVVVGPDRRFGHAEPWLRATLADAGLVPALVEPAATRLDRGSAVPGLVVLAGRP